MSGTAHLHRPAMAPHGSSTLPLAMLGLCLATTSLWWWVAFPPLTAPPPGWLADLQSICLGTLPDGRPAAYGWGLLFTTPAGMFAVLLAGWGRELGPALRRLLSHPAGKALLVLVLAAALGQGGWVLSRLEAVQASQQFTLSAPAGPMPESYPRQHRPAPGFRLVDAQGRERTLADWRGRPVLLTFAFGECSTVCPLVTARLGEAVRQAEAGAATAGGQALPPRGIVVTLDPWRDTPGSLPGLARKWHLPEGVTLLSGSVRQVTAMLDAYEIVRFRDPDTGEIDHVPLVYVIDAEGRLAYSLLNPTHDWMIEAARRAAAPAS